MGDREELQALRRLAELEAKAGGGVATATPSPEIKKRSTGEEVMRQLGLTARYGVEGALALPSLPGDVLGFKSSQGVSDLLTRIGLPKPEGKTERIVGDVARGMAGVPTGMATGKVLQGAASPVAQNVGKVLQTQPGLQAASASTGGLGAGAARELGLGPLPQTIAGLAGAAVPGVAATAPAAVTRRTLAGDQASRQAGIQRVKQFGEAGTTPSVAQAFQKHAGQGTEAFLARDPGGHGVMRDFAMKQAEQIGGRVDDVASILSGKTSPMIAGRAIEEGITGGGGFLEKFKNTSRQLYDRLDTFLPGNKEVPISNMTSALSRLTKPTAGAEELTKTLINSKVLQISQATQRDLAGQPPTQTITLLGANGQPISTVNIGGTPSKNTIPYEALKDIRSRIGEMIADSGMTSDIPRRQLKQLYGALTADMKEAVRATGSKEAQNVFNRANAYTKAGHDRIDNILQPILNKASPEQMFQSAMAGSKEGDSMIHSVMQSLPDKQQRIVAATILKKLGLAAPGKQGAEGNTFSVDTYLTNWNRMSPEAKRSLFSRYGESFTRDLDVIAKTAADIKQGGQVYANPSGTAPALTLQHTLGGALIAMLTGHPGVAAAIGGDMIATGAMSRAMTNPRFVNWLARSTTMPTSSAPAMMNELEQISRQQHDQEKRP